MSDGIPESVTAWQAQRPKLWGDMHRDIELFAPFWREGAEALAGFAAQAREACGVFAEDGGGRFKKVQGVPSAARSESPKFRARLPPSVLPPWCISPRFSRYQSGC